MRSTSIIVHKPTVRAQSRGLLVAKGKWLNLSLMVYVVVNARYKKVGAINLKPVAEQIRELYGCRKRIVSTLSERPECRHSAIG